MIKLRNLICGLLIVFLSGTVVPAAQTVRVGVYENKPKIFTGAEGKPQGIFIDIIESIAEGEGWEIDYVTGTWAEGLQRLENSEIDLMPDVLFSQEREKLYDFNKIIVVYEWLQFYSKSDLTVQSFDDLSGRTIAVLDRSIQESTLRRIVAQLDIQCTVLGFPDYASAVLAVKKGNADVVLANRFFLVSGIDTNNLIASGFIISPAQSFFAVKKGLNPDILAKIDRHMMRLRNDPDSVYYKSLQKWLKEPPLTIIPPILKWISLLLAIGLVFVFVWVVLLKKKSGRQYADLAQTRERYQLLCKNIADGFVLADMNGRINECNEIFSQMLGYTFEELSKLSNQNITPEKWHNFEAGIIENQVLKKGHSDVYEKELVRKDGTVFPVEIRTYLAKDSKGNPDGTWAICRDITERKKTEEFIRNVLDSIGESLVIITPDFSIVHANRAFFKMFSVRPEDLTKKRCYEIFLKTDRPCSETGIGCPVMHTFEKGTEGFSLDTYTNDKGEHFHAETRTFPMKDTSGNTLSVIRVITDITYRKKLEDQLLHSQKMEAIGALTGGIAHDFNNILNVIIGYSDILYRGMKDDNPMKADVGEIIVASERAAHLTRSLLTFSRKQQIELKPVDINVIISELKKMLSRVISEDIELVVELAENELVAMVDAGQMEQVLINLATNAGDAMPEGGVLSIKTGLRELDADFFIAHGYGRPGNYAVIRVEDTGVGIDADKKDKILVLS